MRVLMTKIGFVMAIVSDPVDRTKYRENVTIVRERERERERARD